MTQPRTQKNKSKSKPVPKVAAKKQQRANLQKSTKTLKKRVRSLDTDEEESLCSSLDSDDIESDDEEPVAKKGRAAKKGGAVKKRRMEVEIVEDDVEPRIEDDEIISAEEVSYDIFIHKTCSHSCKRAMASMTIIVVPSWLQSLLKRIQHSTCLQ